MNDDDNGIDWGEGRHWTEEDLKRATAALIARAKLERRRRLVPVLWSMAIAAFAYLLMWLSS